MKKIVDLSGTYLFKLDNEKKGITKHFENDTFTDNITLPTTTSEAKKGELSIEYPLGYLTDIHGTEGYAWYQRELVLQPEDIGKKSVLTLERTRISYLWIDDCFVGTFDSLCTSHCYDLTGYITRTSHKLTIMTSNTDYPVKGGHMTSPDTQTNWNGILGNITLSIYDGIEIQKIKTECDYENKAAILHITLDNHSSMDSLPALIHVFSNTLLTEGYENFSYDKGALPLFVKVSLPLGSHTVTINYPLGDDCKLWDEFEPNIYEIMVDVSATISHDSAPCGDIISTYFGLRKFKANSTHFYINDKKTFLRGKHEGMIFPLTGYAPMNVRGWIKVMNAARSFGINHYRFHTCCPPKAAFEAADLLGIYMEPELPFWGTFTAPEEEGHDEKGQNYLIEEGFRILDAYGNHPSFVMMSMGNELWGSPESINHLLGRYKKYAPHILFTQGSNNFQWVPNIVSNDDFFCGVRFTIDRQIRGSYAMCDQPLGHVQVGRPCTNFNYEEAIFPSYTSNNSEVSPDGTIEIQYGTGVKRVKLTDVSQELIPQIPVISHEIGQYETYPDFNEIQKYTGVLRARNFEKFREALDQKGLLSMANNYFKASGQLAAACYKDELETALRTKDLAGFQILDIQDFSGQGTALVGMLDAFMENKGIITDTKWRNFCSEAVIQAEFQSYICESGKDLDISISLSSYTKEDLINPIVTYTLLCDGTEIEAYTFSTNTTIENGLCKLGSFKVAIPNFTSPSKVTLHIEIENTSIENSYDLWVYPPITIDDFYSTNNLSNPMAFSVEESIKKAKTRNNVLLILDGDSNPNSIQGTYCTDFWCYPMFRGISEWMKKEIPVGTMGLLIRNEHPALADFPSNFYSSPQWWDIVMNSRSTILDDTTIVPVVQTIDNFERNHRLGLIYEVALTDCDSRIVICTSPLLKLIEQDRLEAKWLLKSLLNYINSAQLNPTYRLSTQDFVTLFENKL